MYEGMLSLFKGSARRCWKDTLAALAYQQGVISTGTKQTHAAAVILVSHPDPIVASALDPNVFVLIREFEKSFVDIPKWRFQESLTQFVANDIVPLGILRHFIATDENLECMGQ